jgi:hypothetical protein
MYLAMTTSAVSSRIARILLIAGLALMLLRPSTGFAQSSTVCGAEVKEDVVKLLASVENAPDSEKAAMQEELYKKYQYCLQDANSVPNAFFSTARQCGATVTNLGSLYYEEMACAGYDPQRRQFAAPIKIKQTFGFGGAPLPGSREYVLHCVANSAGVLVPVGRDSVHLANALAGQSPTWQFAVITSATENLQTLQPMNNQTRLARSILSWQLPPTNCNYIPIWGNALNYRIRLDQ